jgi:predicted ATP-dependent protease
MTEPTTLTPSDLRAHGFEDALPESTSDIEPLEDLAGQTRAHEAVAFGLQLEQDGFNIAISGDSASGRNTLATNLLAEAAARKPAPTDWCYLFNFEDPYRPRAVPLPPGTGDDLQRGLNELVELCRTGIPQAFESDSYHQRTSELLEPIGKAREQALEQLSETARHAGFMVNATPMGFIPIPLGRDGQPLSPEVLTSLPKDARDLIEERGQQVQQAIQETIREFRRLDKQAREVMAQLDKEVTRFVIGDTLDRLREAETYSALRDHFDAIEKDIVSNVEQFKRFSDSQLQQLLPQIVAQMVEERELLLHRYAVNLFVTHGDEPAPHAPIVSERNPSYYNLFGRVDYTPRFGSLSTDFTQVRSGAIHQANGGYLVLQLEDLLTQGPSWAKLKRSLKTREAQIEDIGEGLSLIPTQRLVPAPIPLSLKVVLVGRPFTVALLDVLDPEFRELFKIRAEFEPDLDLTPETVSVLAAFIRRTVDACDLVQFSREALAEVVRYSTRLAGRHDRLTTRFGSIADICGEADAVAQAKGESLCSADSVQEAIARHRRRSALVPDRLRRMIAEGMLHVETSGSVVGQVNGLAVYQVGAEAFGTPLRITCRIGLGRRGIVAIEREVERSGAIHSKGVLVLTGYLSGNFGRDRPLMFNASLTFEQSYDEVDGDSASSAELYAILTSLAKVPIRQEVAVTGSVDQFGRIQPVGGVTQKVEGFFDVCREIGLSGTQGVILPATNIVNLTLRRDIVAEIEAGRFHLWPVRTVEEGLEILTGIEAGTAGPGGIYPEGTIFRRVTDTLDEMWQMTRSELAQRPGDA